VLQNFMYKGSLCRVLNFSLLLKQNQHTFLISILPFCRHELHVIVDEIYMLSVFDESATFHSVLGMDR